MGKYSADIDFLRNGARFPKEQVTPLSVPKVQVTNEEWNKAIKVLGQGVTDIEAIRNNIIPELFLSDLVESSDAVAQDKLSSCVPYLYMLTPPAAGHRYVVKYFYKYDDKIEVQIFDYDETEETEVQIVNARYSMDEKVALSKDGGATVGYIYISSADYKGNVYISGEATNRFPYLGPACFKEMQGWENYKERVDSMASTVETHTQNIAALNYSVVEATAIAQAAASASISPDIEADYSYNGTLNSEGANYDGTNPNYKVFYVPVTAGKTYRVIVKSTTDANMYTKIATICYLGTTTDTRTPVVLQDQGTTATYTETLVIPSGVNYLMICQKAATGSGNSYTVNQIITTSELQTQIDGISQSMSAGDQILYYITESADGSQGGTLNWLGDSYGNGAAGFENCMVYYYKVKAGQSYRIRATITAPSVTYPDHIAAICFYTEGSSPTKTPLEILYAGHTESYDFIYTPAVDGLIYICQDTSTAAANSRAINRKIDTSVQAIIQNNATPYYGKKWFACGDSYTMLGAYINHVVAATGMTLIGSTGEDGNGQPLTYMCHLLHSTFRTLVAQADVVTILAGTNDVGSMPNETPGDFETSTAASMTVIDSNEGTVKAAITTIYGAVKSAVAAIRDINKDCLIVFVTQPERSAFTINPNDYSINPSWGYLPNKTTGGLNMQVVADCIADCCKRLGVPCYDFHANGWDYEQNCDDSAAVMAAIRTRIAGGATPSSFLNTDYDGRTYTEAYVEDALTQKYTYDGLHPNSAGADRLGRQIGKFINTL